MVRNILNELLLVPVGNEDPWMEQLQFNKKHVDEIINRILRIQGTKTYTGALNSQGYARLLYHHGGGRGGGGTNMIIYVLKERDCSWEIPFKMPANISNTLLMSAT